MATGNMWENLDVWFLRYTSRQTNRHTNTLITIFRTPSWGGGNENCKLEENQSVFDTIKQHIKFFV